MKRLLTLAIVLLLIVPVFLTFPPKTSAFSYPYIMDVGISYEEYSVPVTPPITLTPEGHMRLWYHLYNPNSHDVDVILGASIQIDGNTYSDPAHDNTVTLKPGDSLSWPNRYFYVPPGVPEGSYTVLYGLWASDWSVRYDLESRSDWIDMVSSVSVRLSSSPSNLGTITWDDVTYSLPRDVHTTVRIHWSGTDNIHCTPPEGYEFHHWEGCGDVDPWDEYSQWTSVSVDGVGCLKAVFTSADVDDTLAVYIGAHPDDIDIGMSGSLYKHDVGRHPILWIVVSDGGASSIEYAYEIEKGWIAEDAQYDVEWKAPDGQIINRPFYSADLARKRIGGYFSGPNWIDDPASHGSSFGTEYDWRTRVCSFVGSNVEKIQLSYPDPYDPSKRWLYPDGSLGGAAETTYTAEIAADVAYEINRVVEANNYRRDLLYINAHAPEGVCYNYDTTDEHNDHRITGNAVLQAIDYLQTTYAFAQIDAKWYTIYNPIQPKPGYSRHDEDISQYKTHKSDLARACWETEFIDSINWDFYWDDYPIDPWDFECFISEENLSPSYSDPTVIPSSGTALEPYDYSIFVDDPEDDTVTVELKTYDPSDSIWEDQGSREVMGVGMASWTNLYPFEANDEGTTALYKFLYDDGYNTGTWGLFEGPTLIPSDSSFSNWNYPSTSPPDRIIPVEVDIANPNGVKLAELHYDYGDDGHEDGIIPMTLTEVLSTKEASMGVKTGKSGDDRAFEPGARASEIATPREVGVEGDLQQFLVCGPLKEEAIAPADGNYYEWGRATTSRGMQDYEPIYETPVFKEGDGLYVWCRINNVYEEVRFQHEWYLPDGGLYATVSSLWSSEPAPGYYYEWVKWYSFYDPLPESVADYEGKWKVKIYVEENHEGHWQYEDTVYFTLRYEIADHTTCKDVQEDDPWDPIDITDSFTSSDPISYSWLKLDNVRGSHELRWKWYDPSGAFYTESEPPFYTDDPENSGYDYWGWYKKSWGLLINGHTPAERPGKWTVKVYINGEYKFQDEFTIYPSSGSYRVEIPAPGIDFAKVSFYVKAFDPRDSLTTSGKHIVNIVDSTSPETSITSGPEGKINFNDVTFFWIGTDDYTPESELLYSYRLDGYSDAWSEWTPSTSKSYTDLLDGYYTFRVKARDKALNEDPTPAERSFVVDTIPPTIVDHAPTQTVVPVTTNIMVTFSEAMDYVSVENAFSTSPSISGSFGWSYSIMTFTPDSDLAYDTTYTAKIGTGAMDLAGNRLLSPYEWQFRTTPGDVDGDGDVDHHDLLLLAGAYGSECGDSNYLPEADFNGDCKIDHEDLVALAANYGKGT